MNRGMIKLIKKLRLSIPYKDTDCRFYPCHNVKNLFCNQCFCDQYPCLNPKYGERMVSGVWDCSKCTIVHTKDYIKRHKEWHKK